MSFHILFPTITIALCWFLVYFRVRHNAAKGTSAAQGWEEAYYLWTKIFALSFALGVVSGITMSFQFGTNWPGFMERGGQHRRAAARLRSADGVLPGVHLPGHHAVRPRPRLRPSPPGGDTDGGRRHHPLGVLDPQPGFVDADAHRLRDHRRAVSCPRLAGGDLQSVVPLSAGAQVARLDAYGFVSHRRAIGLATAARRRQRRHTAGAALGRGRRGSGDPAANLRRRSARAEHTGAPAGQDRRDRSDLAHGEERTAHAVRLARREIGSHRVRRSRCPSWPA